MHCSASRSTRWAPRPTSNKNARDIVTELLADYPQIDFDFDLTQELTLHAIHTQCRESGLEFFVRLLASEGLSWRFGHAAGAARHRLIIFDSRARLPATPGGDIIRFHGIRATERNDAIDGFRHAGKSPPTRSPSAAGIPRNCSLLPASSARTSMRATCLACGGSTAAAPHGGWQRDTPSS